MFNNFYFVEKQEQIHIKPIELHQIAATKQMIIDCAFDVWQTIPCEDFNADEELMDVDSVESTYFGNKGTFLVLIDNQKVVGAGAIKYLTDEIAELKRMWFCKEYRGKGLGFKMAKQLLAFAQAQGYKKVRLDVYMTAQQSAAIRLYKKLGFYEIEAYKNSPAQLFMEKIL